MIKVIATDLDGTLLHPKKPYNLISKRKIKLLNQFYQEGGKIILVSGRGPLFCQTIAKKINLPCGIIACSGAYIELDNRLISQKAIPNTIIQQMMELVQSIRKKGGVIITSDDQQLISKTWKISPVEKLLLRLFKLKNGKYNEGIVISKKRFDNFISQSERGVLKIVFYLSDYIKGNRYDVAEQLRQKYPNDLDIAVTRTGLEITPKGANKGEAISELTKIMSIADQEVAVVGDDGNDIPMFERFYHSFMMKHGYQGAMKSAKYIISDFDQLFAKVQEINKNSQED